MMKYGMNIVLVGLVMMLSSAAWSMPVGDVLELEEAMLGPTCADDLFSEETRNGDVVPHRYFSFEKGVCLYHASDADDSNTARQATALLQAAQQTGLDPMKQNAAALFEGLSFCRAAKTGLAQWQSTGLGKLEFCADWRMGRSALAVVNWGTLNVEYTAPEGTTPTRSFSDLVNDYQACYGDSGTLSDLYTSSCGFIKEASWDALKEAAQNRITGDPADPNDDGLIGEYFEGANSPVTAMFTRKFGMIEKFVGNINSAKTKLENKAVNVTNMVDTQDTTFNDPDMKTKRNQIVDNYKQLILRGRAVLSAIEHLKEGLLVNGEGVDMSYELDNTAEALSGQLDDLENTGDHERLQQIATTAKTFISAKNDIDAVNEKLCKIYFCHLTSQRMLNTTISVSNDFQYFDNPLRIKGDKTIDDGILSVEFDGVVYEKNVTTLCQDAGLSLEQTTVGLDLVRSRTCMDDFEF